MTALFEQAAGQLLIDNVVLRQKNAKLRARRFPKRGARRGLKLSPLRHAEMGSEVKGGAFPFLAHNPNAALHQLEQPRTDGQAQAGPSVLARMRSVGLLERLKDDLLLVAGNSNTGVDHDDMRPQLRSVIFRNLGFEPHPS